MASRKRAPVQIPLPPPVPPGAVYVRIVGLKTKPPGNGPQGMTRAAAFGRMAMRRKQRDVTRAHVVAAGAPVTEDTLSPVMRFMLATGQVKSAPLGHPRPPWAVHVTRIAPSKGLDEHDNLPSALKNVIDGVADALGLKNDRDPRVTWIIGQRQGPRGFYAVDIIIESVAAKEVSA